MDKGELQYPVACCCGNWPDLCRETSGGKAVYYLGCCGCGISGDWKPTEAEAIAAWNTRTQLDELRAENERLRGALTEIMALDGEINPSNYDHDDVCYLNKQFCYSFEIALKALKALGGTNV